MASYLRLILVAVCMINACSCQFFGVEDFQSASQNGGFSINDQHSNMIIANAEFTYDAYLTSVEFFATGPGKIGLSFMGFTTCGRENQESCQAYMNENMVGINYYVPWSELAMIYIEVSQAGYVNYQLPEKMLVPRGYTPYIIQITSGINFVPSDASDLSWPQAIMNSNLIQLKTSDGTPVKALIRFNVESAALSIRSKIYGMSIPNKPDTNTVLEPVYGSKFYLINVPITYDSYIKSFDIFAITPGNVSLTTTTFYGCQIGEEASCYDLLVNYQLKSPYWAGLGTNGIAEEVTLTLEEGYNSFTLPRPIFAQRNSILTLRQSEGQVALERVDVPVADLIDSPDGNGQYKKVGSLNEVFLVSATANYFEN